MAFTKSIDSAVEMFRKLSRFATVKSGHLRNRLNQDNIQVSSIWSQRDLERKENISFTKNYFIQGDANVMSTQPQEISKTEWSINSPSGNYVAVVRKLAQKDGEYKQYVEIWSDKHRLHNISVETLDKHGKIYEDATFGCLQWSHDETCLMYVAERKKTKPTSYFEQKSADDNKPNDKPTAKGEQFVYEDDWGEQLTGKACSVVCILDIDSRTVRVLDYLPDDISAGHAVWCPDDLGVICVGTFQGPFRLGKIYCPIRRSTLFHIDLKTSKCNVLGKTNRSVDSPVFSPDGSQLVYLESNSGGPHCQCTRLNVCNWATKSVTTAKDIVTDIKGSSDFPGLFMLTLNDRCWCKDNKRIVTSTQWRSKDELIIIQIETGEVTRLTNDPDVGTWILLDVYDDVILAACSSPNQPQYLVVGRIPPAGQESIIKWSKLDKLEAIEGLSWEICNIDAPAVEAHQSYSSLNYEYIVLSPVSADPNVKLPMIVFPHGGPHSVFSADFMLAATCFCQLGYIVVCVNYRGSYGFGQVSIDCLPGRVGTQDVQDVQAVAERVLKSSNVDASRVCVMGGSHGGFLTGHLIGQYPEFYKAAAMRNPVINIASMISSSDIPDWTYVECGLPYTDTQVSLGSPSVYEKAWNMSPIRYVDKVTAAVLLAIGQNDRRVPPTQAHEYRKALLARGATVKMLSYPDNSHPILKVDSEADCFINMFKWFSTYSG